MLVDSFVVSLGHVCARWVVLWTCRSVQSREQGSLVLGTFQEVIRFDFNQWNSSFSLYSLLALFFLITFYTLNLHCEGWRVHPVCPVDFSGGILVSVELQDPGALQTSWVQELWPNRHDVISFTVWKTCIADMIFLHSSNTQFNFVRRPD